jgi:mannose-6-phosphate isomerase
MAIDPDIETAFRQDYPNKLNQTVQVVDCDYFTVNLIKFDTAVEKDYNLTDSFIVYMCTQGNAKLEYGDGKISSIRKGETILIPASLKSLSIIPGTLTSLLEIIPG